MPTPAFTDRTWPEHRAPGPWTFEAQGDACCYAISSPNGKWLATIRFNGEHSEAQDLATLALFDVANRTHEQSVLSLEESTKMLSMCHELLEGPKHGEKAKLIAQRIEQNRALLEDVYAGSVSTPTPRPPLNAPALTPPRQSQDVAR